MVFHDLEQVRYCKSSWSPALCEFLGINCKYFSFNRPKKVILRTVGKCRVLSEIVGKCRKLSEIVGNCRKMSENVGVRRGGGPYDTA